MTMMKSKSEDFDESFNYRSVIGKTGYLKNGTRMDLAYINHQCARFVVGTKIEHVSAVRRMGRYIKQTLGKGIIFLPDTSRGLECHVNADFSGNWDLIDTQCKDTARSRHGYIISYEGCPLIWKSQLQTEIALSSTESEYTGLSYAMRETIPIIQLLWEMNEHGLPVVSGKMKMTCQVYEDNSGALEMARNDKYQPRTKHLNIRLHHFRQYVEDGTVEVKHIRTDVQPADILTKQHPHQAFEKHRKTLMGW